MPFFRSIETEDPQPAGNLKKEMPMPTILGHDLLKLIYNKQQEQEKGPLSPCGGRRILPNDRIERKLPCLRDAANRVGQTPLFQMTEWWGTSSYQDEDQPGCRTLCSG